MRVVKFSPFETPWKVGNSYYDNQAIIGLKEESKEEIVMAFSDAGLVGSLPEMTKAERCTY